jgi:hypothetical protein
LCFLAWQHRRCGSPKSGNPPLENYVQQGLEIHGLKECGPWRYTVFNWVPKHFVHFVRVLHGNTKDVHPSLLRIFGFSAISTNDSNLQSMLKTNELI